MLEGGESTSAADLESPGVSLLKQNVYGANTSHQMNSVDRGSSDVSDMSLLQSSHRQLVTKKKSGKASSESSKLNLDLEVLKPKYDNIFPQIFDALEYVEEPHVRAQFECLLSDVYDTFLQPELSDRKTPHQPSQFLDTIQKFLQAPALNRKQIASDATKLREWKIAAVSKLDQAKALQKRVNELNTYFTNVLSTFDETSAENLAHDNAKITHTSEFSDSSSKHAEIDHEEMLTKGSSLLWDLGNLNRTQHCLTESDGRFEASETESRPLKYYHNKNVSVAKSVSHSEMTEVSQDQTTSEATYTFENIVASSKKILNFRDKQGIIQNERFDLRELKEKRKANAHRNCATDMKSMRRMVDSVQQFQLNLPPLVLREQTLFFAKSPIGLSKTTNPFRDALGSCFESSVVELTEDGIVDKCNSRYSKSTKSNNGVTEDSDLAEGLRAAQGMPYNSCVPKIRKVVDKVTALGIATEDRRTRIDAIKKSNKILTEQITEVESTLDSFDNYLAMVKHKPCPVPPEALRREMYAFQEAMMERIFTCIDILASQMKALRKTEQTKTDKMSAMLARYEETKKETPEALVVVAGVDSTAGKRFVTPQKSIIDPDLLTGLRAVVKGLETFQASCEDIWDETMSRIFTELEELLNSASSGPVKRWSPEDASSVISSSVSSPDTLESDIENMKELPQDKSKYGSVVVFSLRVLERVSSQFSHLMMVTRIRDLQVIYIDHSIGLAYMAMKQMLSPVVTKNSNIQNKRCKQKKMNCKVAFKENRRPGVSTLKGRKQKDLESKAEESENKEKAKSPEAPRRRRLTDNNLDKRHLKFRLWEGREPHGDDAEARSANKDVLSNQLEEDNAQHMGSVVTMRLPLIQDNSSLHLERETGSKLVPTSRTNGISPWIHVEEKADSSQPTERMQEPPEEMFEEQWKESKKDLPTISNAKTNKVKHLTTKRSRPSTETRDHGSALYHSEKMNQVNITANHEKTRHVHRPIQYCRVLAMPTPPSADKITYHNKAKKHQDFKKFHRKQQ